LKSSINAKNAVFFTKLKNWPKGVKNGVKTTKAAIRKSSNTPWKANKKKENRIR
jgi:hypothetical protein